MADKRQVRIEFNAAALHGKAEFNAKQLANLEYTGAIRLNPDLLYVIPKQWVHSENLLRPINGKDKSNKVFVLGFKDEHLETVFSLALNGLNQQFYGTVRENPKMLISAVQNGDNLYRAIAGTSQISVWTKGGLPVYVQGSNAYIPYDVAFRLVGREAVWTGKFKETKTGSGKWNMLVKTIDGDTFLDLGIQSMNMYATELEVPEYTNEQLGEAQEHLTFYQTDLPQH